MFLQDDVAVSHMKAMPDGARYEVPRTIYIYYLPERATDQILRARHSDTLNGLR